MAKVYGGGRAPGDRVFGAIERPIFRLCGIDPAGEQRWTTYAYSLLAFSLVSVLVLYAQLRLQGHLPINPDHFGALKPALSFNTSISFLTNTNWQNYGDGTIAQLTQMAGLAFHNFVSAAAGAAVAVALIRGLVRRKTRTLGSFWVDLVRTCVRVLLPLAFVAGLVLISQGVVQNLHGPKTVHTVAGATQVIPGGPVGSQEAIKEGGQNGGGFFNANSSHPFENPNGISNFVEILLILLIPFSFPFMFGKMAGDRKQGWVIFGAMFVLWITAALLAMNFESHGNVKLTNAGANQAVTATQGGGNMEGKEVRFGPTYSAMFEATTTGTSTGSVNSSHDSFTPIGGLVALIQMQLGEVDPGGIGAGIYFMLVFVVLSVFIAGLMVGRTPEYLGKKIESKEVRLAALAVLIDVASILGFTAVSVVHPLGLAGLTTNTGAHGFSEILYQFSSATANNGSAFAGLSGNNLYYNTTGASAMWIGRFLEVIPILALAGALAGKKVVPASAGTFATDRPLFVGLLIGVVLIVGALTFFPALALGPILEQLQLAAGHLH
jgi:K+-transporting ATPase ATPase A chain